MKRAAILALFLTACTDDSNHDDPPPAEDAAAQADAAGGAAGQGGAAGEGGAAGQGGQGGDPGDVGVVGSNPFLPRVENETCTLPTPPPLGDIEVYEAYPGMTFERPLWFGFAPDDPDRRFVLEQGGRIRVFSVDNPDAVEVFLQHPVSRNNNEEGLLGMAFHPQYADNGKFYVYYSAAGPRRSVISEFQVDPQSANRSLPDSERVLLEVRQPYGNHNGGDIHFGPDDGYLYITFGDGGAAGDPDRNGQNTDTLLATVARIDVDTDDPVCGTPYGIPPDNPFADGRCVDGHQGRAEIFAWGLRNVWRMSFDRSTGELWAGDVGQGTWEEIDIVRRGKNYGWNQVEGFECYVRGCDPSGYEPPVYAYGRRDGKSITGGFVYRGPDLPELWGSYIFADYDSGRIWALRETDGEPEVTLLADTEYRIASFGEDPEGRLFIVNLAGRPSLLRMRRRAGAEGGDPVPALLSETGCYADTAAGTPAPGVIPYFVNARLWSDNAEKRRYLALPPGTEMFYADPEGFGFPRGAILMKEFAIRGQDGEARRLETRFYHRSERGWLGYTYKWNEEQTDAVLLESDLTEAVEGPAGEQVWAYPSRAQCDNCHTESAQYALGLSARQLNRQASWNGVAYDQLGAFAEAGYITLPPEVPAFPIDDQDVAARARALLDSNCAPCHQPEGPGNAQIDLRATTPLADTGLCDVVPGQGDLGIENARLIAPGDPDRSVLLSRMERLDTERMPPLGTSVVDVDTTTLLRRWIQNMNGCP